MPWNDLDSFEQPVAYGAMRKTGLQVHRRNGSTVYAALYSAGPFNRASFADEVIVKLEQLRPEQATTPGHG